MKQDLLKRERSVLRIVLGIVFFAISIERILSEQGFTTFDWFYSGIFALNGIYHSIEGWGFSIAKLLGSAFIVIDNERISIKPGIFESKQNFAWQTIQSIHFQINRFQISTSGNENRILDLSKFDHDSIKEIKAVIDQIARDKAIPSDS